MEHKEILKRLRVLAKSLTTHTPNCNWGGCAVVAGWVGKELKSMGVMVEVITPVSSPASIWGSKPAATVRLNVTNHKDPRNWDENGLSRTHLAVRFRSAGKTYTWDSNGLVQSTSAFGKCRDGDTYTTSKKFGDGMSVEECVAIASTSKGWNDRFDRKQIPLIKHLIKHHLTHGL